jgi:hypothetical protein
MNNDDTERLDLGVDVDINRLDRLSLVDLARVFGEALYSTEYACSREEENDYKARAREVLRELERREKNDINSNKG